METLPIDVILPEAIKALSRYGTLVLKAAPGAGKTTRVPPAILDNGLAYLEGKKNGQIVVLQPRRVAAQAAAARMAQERGGTLGGEIGYRVRHEGKSCRDTRVLVCTTGVFLRRLQDDPSIEDIAVVVFDEFHERSVDSDLALALTYQVKREIRPDLSIVVMSATLDCAPIAAYLDNCPALECPGRTYPVQIDYLNHPPSLPLERLALDGVERMLTRTAGDLLVFLPGVGEINKTETALQSISEKHKLAIMPLYGDMPLAQQQDVLRPVKNRKVVLATNVAETSLTIDGVTAVIDSGFARVNRFDSAVGFNRLELSRISKAAAAQRAGRAGRTAAGFCLRLWSEKEQNMLSEFELPEIERLELSECILQLFAWGEHNIESFPWFEKPSTLAIEKAQILLTLLGAITDGALTDLGRAMSRLPLPPRLAALLLQAACLGQAKRGALCAALLAERSPFKVREMDRDAPQSNHTDSDVLEQIKALEKFAESGERHSIMGELFSGGARQIIRSADQLLRLIEGMDYVKKANKTNDVGAVTDKQHSADADNVLLRAILAAFPDRVCKRRQARDPRAVMVGGRGVKLAQSSTVCDAELFVAVDIVDLNKAELAVRRASAIDQSWLPDNIMKISTEVMYEASRQKVLAFRRKRFADLILEETVTSIPPEVDPGSVLAQAVLANFDLTSLVDEEAGQYLERVLCLKEWMPELSLPDFGENPWAELLPIWCCGCSSINELKANSLTQAIKSKLTQEQIFAVDKEAPEQFVLPGGRRVKIEYQVGKAPVLAARIQEFFGVTKTPSIARSRVSMMLHLLAPNYRVQQITNDLGSFWQNTYPEIKKELKGRYPKHAWPDDPRKPVEPRAR